MGKHSEQRTLEGFMMKNGLKNESFYTQKLAKDITAIACYYNRKVMTERVIVVSNELNPLAYKITKVTFTN